MHEKREISWTSWSNDQDRSAKAINRKADTNVQEKSDCAVIPVNQPNKGRELSAEAGKGRAQTQENTVQSHIRPTHSGKRMSQGLHGVRQAARGRKQRGTGRQNRSTGRGDDPQPDLRGRLQRLLLRVSARSRPASSARRAGGGHPMEAGELGARWRPSDGRPYRDSTSQYQHGRFPRCRNL